MQEKNLHQSRFLEAPLVRQADGELKNIPELENLQLDLPAVVFLCPRAYVAEG